MGSRQLLIRAASKLFLHLRERGPDSSMEFHEPGFWMALVIGLFCLAVFILWLWKGE